MTPLSAPMLEVIGRIGRRAVTAHELGVNGCVLKALWERGLLIADREGYPPIYRISPAGQALVEVMTGRVVLTDAEGTVERIKRTVAAHYRIPVGEMISARRSRNVAFPRQIAMYLARELTPHSLPRIGHFFGDRDHTTVMHALSSVERKMRDNPQLEETIGELFHGLRESIVERSAFRVADGPLAEA